MIESSQSIEEEIDILISSVIGNSSPHDDSISTLDSLLIIAGVLAYYADFHILSPENKWYHGSVYTVTRALQKETLRLEALGLLSSANISQTHTHVMGILNPDPNLNHK